MRRQGQSARQCGACFGVVSSDRLRRGWWGEMRGDAVQRLKQRNGTNVPPSSRVRGTGAEIMTSSLEPGRDSADGDGTRPGATCVGEGIRRVS